MHYRYRIVSIFLLGVVFFGLLAFPSQASAQLGFLINLLVDPAENLVEGLAKLLATVAILVPGYIFFAVSSVTNFFIDATINIGVTTGSGCDPTIGTPVNTNGTPCFVQYGWEFSRNFVNMLFLLILVFIGLATILRLQEYQLQRTLPKLILIALLVNFSGLLVGFLVDIGNLATTFFLSNIDALGSDSFGTMFENALDEVNELFGNQDNFLAALASTLAFGAVMGFFFLFATFAYLMVAVTFFLRLIILWVLVILAPFAFAAYILPATRGWWNKWWSTLTTWAFITVPLAFFMFLANIVLDNPITALIPPTGTLQGDVGFMENFVAAMLSPMVAIVLLFVGLGMSAGMSGTFSKVRAWAGKATAVTAGMVGRDLIRDKWLARSENAQKFASRLENFSSRGMKSKNVLGQTIGRASAPFVRFAGRKMGSEAQEKVGGQISAAETEAKDWSPEKTASMLKGNVKFEKKLGWLNAKIKSGDIDDVVGTGPNQVHADQIKPILDRALDIGQHRDLESALPNFLTPHQLQTHRRYSSLRNAAASRHGVAVGALTHAQIQEELLRRMKPDRAKQVSGTIVSDPGWQEAMLRGWSGSHISNFISEHGEGITALENRLRTLSVSLTGDPRVSNIADKIEEAEGIPRTDAERRAQMRLWLQDNRNQPLAKYLQSQAGQNLGFSV